MNNEELEYNLAKIAESCIKMVVKINELEAKVNKLELQAINFDIQINTLHQRSHTHAPMYGNFSGQIPSTPIDCLNVAR